MKVVVNGVVADCIVANSYDVLVQFVKLTMDKSADLKDLDLTCASRGVWLVKVGNMRRYLTNGQARTVVFVSSEYGQCLTYSLEGWYKTRDGIVRLNANTNCNPNYDPIHPNFNPSPVVMWSRVLSRAQFRGLQNA